MGGSNSFLRFLFSSVKQERKSQNISGGVGDTNMAFNVNVLKAVLWEPE